jgi:TP901 family phage tail tape measure protein
VAFSDYVLIRYLATFTDNASRQAAITNKRIRDGATATSAAQLSASRQTVTGLNNVARAATASGKALSTYVTLPVLAVGAASVKMAVDFNTAMTRVHALTGANAAQIDKWSKSIQTLAVQTGQGPKALADSLYYVASAGLATSQVMPVVRDSAKAAATGMGDAAVVADVLTSALNAYRGSGLTAKTATDNLVAAIKYGKGEPTDFATSLGRIIGPAAQLNVSFGQTTGAIAALTNQGLDASEAVTGLRQVFVEFLKPSANATKVLKSMGFTADELRLDLAKPNGLMKTLALLRVHMGGLGIDTKKLGEITKTSGTAAGLAYISKNSKSLSDSIAGVFPNVRALNAFLLLTGKGAAKAGQTIRQVAHDNTALNKAFSTTVQQSASFRLHQLWATVQVDLISFGNVVLPILDKVAIKLTGWFKALAHLSPGTRTLIVEAGLLVAALGPMLYIFGSILLVGTAVGSLFLDIPIAMAIATAAFLAAGLTAKNGLAHPLNLVHQIIGTLKKDWPTIKKDATSAFTIIGRVAADTGHIVIDFFKMIHDFYTGDWSGLWQNAEGVLNHFGDIASIVFKGLERLVPDAIKAMTASWQNAATALGLLAVAMIRIKTVSIGSFLGGGGGGAAVAGESGIAAQFGAGFGASRLGGGIARLRRGGLIPGLTRSIYQDAIEAQSARNLASSGVVASGLTKGAPRLFAGGGAVAGAAVTAESAAAFGAVSNFQKLQAVGKTVLPTLGAIGTTLGTAGIAGAAIAAGVGIYFLVKALTGGESATQKMHDQLMKLTDTQGSLRRLAGSVGPMALQLQSSRLNLKDLTNQLSEYRQELAKAKPHTQEYQQLQLQISETTNARAQAMASLRTQTSQYNKELSAEISRGDALLRQERTTTVGQVVGQIGGSNGATRGLVQQILRRIQSGSQNAGALFGRFFGGPLGAKQSQTLGISKDDIRNLIIAVQQNAKLKGTIDAMSRAYQQMRIAGIDPASRAMGRLRREITLAAAQHFNLSVPGALALSKASGQPVTAESAAALQSVGGISSGVIQLGRMLQAIPTVKQIRFVSNLPQSELPALREFAHITHTLPTRQVLTMAVNAGPASLAVTAFIAKNEKRLEGFKAKKVDKIVGDVVNRLKDVPKQAMAEITRIIEKTGKLPASIDKIVARVRAANKRLATDQATFVRDQAIVAAHPGAAGDKALGLGALKARIARETAAQNQETAKPKNRIKFHISFTGAGTSGAADKSLAASLTATLNHVSTQVSNRVISQRLFKPVGESIPQGVAVEIDTSKSITFMGHHMMNALGTDANSGLLGRTMKGIKAGSPSQLWASTVGQAITAGIAVGLSSAQAAAGLNSALNAVLQGALSFAKAHLKISSPSKVADERIGYPIAQGIAQGIRRGKGIIGKAVEQVVQHAVSQSRGAMGGSGGGGGFAGSAAAGAAQQYARSKMKQFGWGPSEWGPLQALWERESGWNYLAKNSSSGAYGIPQSLPASKMASAGSDYLTNFRTQINWGLGYIHGRYGSPSAAWAHEGQFNWYDMGGVVPGRGPQMAVVHGGETILPTHRQDANVVHHIKNAVIHAHNLTIPKQSAIWIEKILRAFGFYVANPTQTVARIKGDIANIMTHTKLDARQKQEIAHFQSEYNAELLKKATTPDQKLAKQGRLASIQYSISRVEGQTQLTQIQQNELTKYQAELKKVLRQERITEMLRRFIAALQKHTLAHMEAVRHTIEDNIARLRKGGVTPREKAEIKILEARLAAVDGVIVQRLRKQTNTLNYLLTQADQGLTNLQLRQQLQGIDQTQAGQAAQAAYIKKNIIPNLEKQLNVLKQQEKAARDIHNKALARKIAEEIKAKLGDILQAQLDAQNAIKAATQATQDALGGGTTITFGYQNQQWTTGQVALGTGA